MPSIGTSRWLLWLWPFTTSAACPASASQNGARSPLSPWTVPALYLGECQKASRQVPGRRSWRFSQRTWADPSV